jgi:hypothetical protein
MRSSKFIHRAWLRMAMSTSSAVLLMVGCAADVSPEGEPVEVDPTAMRQELALEKLESFRIPTETAEFHVFEGRELVRLHGDLNFDVRALVEGEYDQVLDPNYIIEKGFKSVTMGRPVSDANSINIKLAWGTGAETPTESDKTRFRNAGSSWSNAMIDGHVASRLSIRDTNTGPNIRIRRINGFTWPSGSPCASGQWGCIDAFPNGTTPSANLFYKSDINPGDNPNQCDWTTSLMAAMARHELGHAIGFMHPGDGTQQSGTLGCGGVSGCQLNPPYPTIMRAGIAVSPFPGCAAAIDSLQPDDLDLAATIY